MKWMCRTRAYKIVDIDLDAVIIQLHGGKVDQIMLWWRGLEICCQF